MFRSFNEKEGTGGIQSSRWFIKELDTWVPEHLNTDANSPAFSTRTSAFPVSIADPCIGKALETKFEKRAIVDFEQPVRDVDAEIGVDPDQIGIEGRMMDFR